MLNQLWWMYLVLLFRTLTENQSFRKRRAQASDADGAGQKQLHVNCV